MVYVSKYMRPHGNRNRKNNRRNTQDYAGKRHGKDRIAFVSRQNKNPVLHRGKRANAEAEKRQKVRFLPPRRHIYNKSRPFSGIQNSREIALHTESFQI